MSQPKIAGVILAGGQSQRMGTDKCAKILAGQSLAERALKYTKENTDFTYVMASAASVYPWPKTTQMLFDDPSKVATPLNAMLHALTLTAKQKGIRWLAFLSVDTPFLPDNLFRKLVEQGEYDKADIVMPTSQQQCHFTHGVWRIGGYFPAPEKENQGIKHYLKSVKSTTLSFQATPFDPFFNINTPEDFHKAQAQLEKSYSL